jgi:hypothetical protein
MPHRGRDPLIAGLPSTIWRRLFNMCYEPTAIGNKIIYTRLCYPDGKAPLEQPNILLDIFSVIKMAKEKNG